MIQTYIKGTQEKNALLAIRRPQWKKWVQMSAEEFWSSMLEIMKSKLEKENINITAIKPVEYSL